jgi:hypothetical protein
MLRLLPFALAFITTSLATKVRPLNARADIPPPGLVFFNGTVEFERAQYNACSENNTSVSLSDDGTVVTVETSNLTSYWDSETDRFQMVDCYIYFPVSAPEGWQYSLSRIEVTGEVGLVVPDSYPRDKAAATLGGQSRSSRRISNTWGLDFMNILGECYTEGGLLCLPLDGIQTFKHDGYFTPPGFFGYGSTLSTCGWDDVAEWWSDQNDRKFHMGFTEMISVSLSVYGPSLKSQGLKGFGKISVTRLDYHLDWKPCTIGSSR